MYDVGSKESVLKGDNKRGSIAARLISTVLQENYVS
jgi:hypothetical protein